MYGMVNQAIKKMLESSTNPDLWTEVAEANNIPKEGFNPLSQYDDAITGNLVVSISEITGKPAPDLLEDFGVYWIQYAKTTEYAGILETFGETPVDLISSLDALHSRLKVSFEDLKPPSFWVENIGENEIIVNYYSERDMPLEYFVKGLLRGIFESFGQKCHIEMIEPSDASVKCKFNIKY